jgi:hypothetical protein
VTARFRWELRLYCPGCYETPEDASWLRRICRTVMCRILVAREAMAHGFAMPGRIGPRTWTLLDGNESEPLRGCPLRGSTVFSRFAWRLLSGICFIALVRPWFCVPTDVIPIASSLGRLLIHDAHH